MADFEAIYIQYYENVYKYILSLCKNKTLAEDITQEAFYKAMTHLNQFKGKCTLYVWLCQIAKNTYYTIAKKQNLHTSETDINLYELSEPSIENYISDKETAWEIHKFLHKLNEPYKEVFSLRIFGELSFSQIGELFNKTDSWARLIFHRAKNQLRRCLYENKL